MNHHSHKSNWRNYSFRDQDLTGHDFSGADIRGADFTRANLSQANFSQAKAGLPPFRAIGTVLIAMTLAVLSSFFAGTTGSMSATLLSNGSQATFAACWIILIVLPVFVIMTIRQGFGKALSIAALAAMLAMILPIVLAWLGLIRGQLTGGATGIFAGMLCSALVGTGAGVFALGITIAGIVSPIAAILTAIVGVLFNTATFVGAIGFVGMVLMSKHLKPEELSQQVLTNQIPPPEFQNAAEAMSGSLAIAGVIILLGFLSVTGLGCYLGWHILSGREQYLSLRQLAVTIASLGGTQFQNANLTEANFQQAILKSTNFQDANLTRTNFLQVQFLHFARLDRTLLTHAKVRHLLTGRNGANMDFKDCYHLLRAVDLQKANLINSHLENVDLSDANLQEANLSDAWLINTKLDGANLQSACLTGACLDRLTISEKTNLKNVQCDYIFMRHEGSQPTNRVPLKSKFATGEFERFIRASINPVTLCHNMDFNPEAAWQALNQIATLYQEPLTIIGLEQQFDQNLILKLEPPKKIDRQQLEQIYPTYYQQYQSQVGQQPNSQEIASQLTQLVHELRSSKTTIQSVYSTGLIITGGNVTLNTSYSSPSLTQILDNLSTQRTYTQQFKTLLQKLYQAIELEQNLKVLDKYSAIEKIKTLAEIWQNPSTPIAQRQQYQAISFLKGMQSELNSNMDLHRSFQQLLPAITNLLDK